MLMGKSKGWWVSVIIVGLGLIASVITIKQCFSADPATKESLVASDSARQVQHTRVIDNQAESLRNDEKILERLESLQVDINEELALRYPLGTVLFYTSIDGPVIRLSSTATDTLGLAVDMDSASLDVQAFRQDRMISIYWINLRLGGHVFRKLTIGCGAWEGNRVGVVSRFGGKVDVLLEVLNVGPNSATCVLGFVLNQRMD